MTTPGDIPDADKDLLSDEEEIFDYGTDPRDADTDADGAPDDAEVFGGSDPTDPSDLP